MANTTRNNTVLMPPYLKEMKETPQADFPNKEAKGLCMSFHNYKPLI